MESGSKCGILMVQNRAVFRNSRRTKVWRGGAICMILFLSTVESETERVALEELYEKYYKEMHRQAFSVLRDKDEAEDAVQNAFFGIWKRLDALRNMDQNRKEWYVICAARNAAIDIYRKRKERLQKEEPFDKSFPYAFSMDEYMSDNIVYEKIACFPDRERDVLMLKYIYGFRYKEMARLLGVSVEAIKKALVRARDRLEKTCREEGIYND